MFEISVKRAFTASHALLKDGLRVEEPHEHRFECEAVFTGDGLDEIGVAMDFRVVDEALSEVLAPLNDAGLNGKELLPGMSPSAENLALFIFRGLAETLAGKDARLARVTVWEDRWHGATYFE